MAQVKRSDIERDDRTILPYEAGGHRYDAGGHIAQLQAELAQRLTSQGADHASVLGHEPSERIVRFVSAGGGYLALCAAYVTVAAAVVYWM